MARRLLDAGKVPYLLLPVGPDLERILGEIGDLDLDLVADVVPHQAPAWFVVSHYHRGIPLRVYRVGRAPRGRQ